MKGNAGTAALSGLVILFAVAGCTSTEVLQPSALVSTETSGASQPPQSFPLAPPATAVPAAPTQAPTQVAAITTNARVRFAPVVGAPSSASTPMASRISARAGQRGIGLTGADDAAATHVLKGYFSVISDAGERTVIYVWDVLDPAGTRIHRIQGQAKGPAGQGEGWDGVQPATMETIADQTVDQLATWLAGTSG